MLPCKSAPQLDWPPDRGAAGDAACDRAKGPVTFGRSQSLAELDPEGQRPEGAHGGPIWHLILQFETNALQSSEVTYWVQTVLVIKDTIKMNKKYCLVIILSCI